MDKSSVAFGGSAPQMGVMPKRRKTHPSNAIVLINPGSGTVRSLGKEAVEQAIRTQLGGVYGRLDIEFLDDDFEVKLGRAATSPDYDVIIVGGGDGTINAAASRLMGTDKVLGPLPLGTMNLFVRALGYEQDFNEALTQLRDARPMAVDVGIVNDRVFLHQVSFGLQPRMAKIRERIGYRSRASKLFATLRAALAILYRPNRVRLRLDVDGEAKDLKVPMVLVSNNRLGDGGTLYLPNALDRGELGFYVLHDASPRQLLRLARAYLAGARPDLDVFDASTVVNLRVLPRNRRGKRKKLVAAALDGEIVSFAPPIDITVRPKGLNVLVPQRERASPEAPV
jgi:diacylglycerol kinase family enzyme